MARVEFAAPSRVIFGDGTAQEAGAIAGQLGTRAFVTAGHRENDLATLIKTLAEKGVGVEVFEVRSEPTVELVQEGLRQAKATRCDLVIGFGGGSAIDTGKAISALMTNPGDPLDYLEVVGKNQPLTRQAAPMIAFPTTAGTGSEVTRNAVLAVPEKGMKVSLRSPLMLPAVAIVDPQLTYNLPPDITAATGMDALAQVIEPYVSIRANPIADLFCLEGIRRSTRSLKKAFRNGTDIRARSDCSFASLMGGLALANAGLGAVHGFASPIGGLFPAPHGAVCAVLLPPVVEINCRAISAREPSNIALARYIEIAQMVTGDPEAQIKDLIQWLFQLRRDLNIKGLSAYGLTSNDILQVVVAGPP